MTEFFITARSFAAPFFSDDSDAYIEAESAQAALEKFAAGYTHPAGLYAAEAWESADAQKKGGEFLAQWICNHERAKQDAVRGKGAYSYLGHGPGDFEINGERIKVANPSAGAVV